MSLTDPTTTRAPRVVLAGALGVLALIAGAAFGWGSAFGSLPNDSLALDRHAAAFIAGLWVTILAGVAALFALPRRWRHADVGIPTMLGLFAAVALAMGAGRAVADRGLHPVLLAFVVPGVALAIGAWLHVHHTAARARLHDYLAREGVTREGYVTACSQTGSVNGAPRWSYVVTYTDTEGRQRWVTQHVTTFSPPSRGSHVTVTYDPAEPGDQRRILVS